MPVGAAAAVRRPRNVQAAAVRRPRNDPAQYDDLVAEWWKPRGAFEMLHWIAAARATLVPPARRPGAVLLDIGCGGGVLAPHLAGKGYRHLGVDLSATGVTIARSRGIRAVRADATRLPVADEAADVVVAGELLEHVPDLDGVLAEAVRVLRPGGTLVLDTIANTWWGRFSSITVAERMPAGPPPRLHDGRLFVDRDRLVAVCAALGVRLTLRGLLPSLPGYLRWLAGRAPSTRMVSVRSTAGLFQAYGVKA